MEVKTREKLKLSSQGSSRHISRKNHSPTVFYYDLAEKWKNTFQSTTAAHLLQTVAPSFSTPGEVVRQLCIPVEFFAIVSVKYGYPSLRQTQDVQCRRQLARGVRSLICAKAVGFHGSPCAGLTLFREPLSETFRSLRHVLVRQCHLPSAHSRVFLKEKYRARKMLQARGRFPKVFRFVTWKSQSSSS